MIKSYNTIRFMFLYVNHPVVFCKLNYRCYFWFWKHYQVQWCGLQKVQFSVIPKRVPNMDSLAPSYIQRKYMYLSFCSTITFPLQFLSICLGTTNFFTILNLCEVDISLLVYNFFYIIQIKHEEVTNSVLIYISKTTKYFFKD